MSSSMLCVLVCELSWSERFIFDQLLIYCGTERLLVMQ